MVGASCDPSEGFLVTLVFRFSSRPAGVIAERRSAFFNVENVVLTAGIRLFAPLDIYVRVLFISAILRAQSSSAPRRRMLVGKQSRRLAGCWLRYSEAIGAEARMETC